MSNEPDKFKIFEAHAKDGYANAQETIRFVDTKAGALIGLVTILTGFPVLVAQWVLDKEASHPFSFQNLYTTHPKTSACLFFCLFGSLICGLISLYCALDAITARPTSHKVKKCRKIRATVLFPINGGTKDTAYLVRAAREGMTNRDVALEYGAQLVRVGSILNKKIKYLRCSVSCFKAQLGFIILCAGAAIILFVYGNIFSEQHTETKEATSSLTTKAIAEQGNVDAVVYFTLPDHGRVSQRGQAE